jgi:hypothetical protein
LPAQQINPPEGVRDLVSANALGDFQHFQAASFVAERGIEAGATLFDVSEVEGRGIVEVGIGDGDGGLVGDGQGPGRMSGGRVTLSGIGRE